MKIPKEKVFQIPPERYPYFREKLFSATQAREELMRHLQTLIKEESRQGFEAWKEIARICGFDSYDEMKQAGMGVKLDWVKCTITLHKIDVSEI